jgi:WD40 repeat protein
MTLNDHSDWIRSCTVSPDNLYIVSGSNDKTLKVWDFKTGNCNMTLNGHSGRVNSCAVSPNNRYIISGSDDNTLKLWDAESGSCISTMIHLPQNQTASWNGKAQKLLSASEEAWRWIGLSSGLRRLPVELLGTKKSVV